MTISFGISEQIFAIDSSAHLYVTVVHRPPRKMMSRAATGKPRGMG